MSGIIGFALERAREPSTWRGAVWLLAACGVSLSPTQAAAIIAAGAAVAGAIGVFFPDPKGTPQA